MCLFRTSLLNKHILIDAGLETIGGLIVSGIKFLYQLLKKGWQIFNDGIALLLRYVSKESEGEDAAQGTIYLDGSPVTLPNDISAALPFADAECITGESVIFGLKAAKDELADCRVCSERLYLRLPKWYL